MKSTKLKLTMMVTIAGCVAGYCSGLYLGYRQGIQQGKEIGREQEIAHIKKNLWKRSLEISSASLDDSELVILRQFTYPADHPFTNVFMKENKDALGLTVKKIYNHSGMHGMGGAFWDSMWQIKNSTNKPQTIDNSLFANLPEGYDVTRRPFRDPIIVNPSEQAAPSNR